MAAKLVPTKTHTLKHPITLTRKGPAGAEVEETVTEIEVRKPLAGDLRSQDGASGEASAKLQMMAHLTGQPMMVIDQLEIVDFMALDQLVADFLNPGPSTGGTASEA